MNVVVIAIAMLLVAVLAAEPLLAAWPVRRHRAGSRSDRAVRRTRP